MLILILRRLGSMVLIMLVVSLILFAIFETDKLAVAGKVLGPYSSTEQREIWLEENGYNQPFWTRYVIWAGIKSFVEAYYLRAAVLRSLGRADDAESDLVDRCRCVVSLFG